MWEFDPDEFIFTIVSVFVALVGLVHWYARIARVSHFCSPAPQRTLLSITPVLSFIILYVVLQTLADPLWVVGRADYTLLFMAGGVAWLFVWLAVLPLLGLSVRDDALERINPAAAITVCGAIFGIMFAYAGSNIGNGPTIWTTILPALVAAISLFVLWIMLELLQGGIEAITIERDTAAGIRLAVFLACTGVILGRAMAGDWFTWADTFRSFLVLAVPAIGLMLLCAIFNWIFRATPENPRPSIVASGLLPAGIMLAIAIFYVLYLGWPEIAPPGQYMVPER